MLQARGTRGLAGPLIWTLAEGVTWEPPKRRLSSQIARPGGGAEEG